MRQALSYTLISLTISSFASAAPDTSIYLGSTDIYKTDRHTYMNPAGMPITPLTCKTIVSRKWTFNSLSAGAYCQPAIRACNAYELMKKQVKKPILTKRDIKQSDIKYAEEMKNYHLNACQLAVDVHNAGIPDIGKASGLK